MSFHFGCVCEDISKEDKLRKKSHLECGWDPRLTEEGKGESQPSATIASSLPVHWVISKQPKLGLAQLRAASLSMPFFLDELNPQTTSQANSSFTKLFHVGCLVTAMKK